MGDGAEDLEDLVGTSGWKSSTPGTFELDGAKEGDFLVSIATLDVLDSDGHVTAPGAFPKKSIAISAYGHTSWPEKGARLPVGRGDLGEKGSEALVGGRFFLDTTHGKDTYLTVKALDELQEWSYGYKILGAERTGQKTQRGKPVIRLKSLDVREASPTLVGAGVGTRTIGIKSGDESGPLAGLPFGEDFDRVLVDVEAIVSRSKSLRDLRVKEGRELSEANRARVLRLRDSIGQLAELDQELRELLERTERNDPAVEDLGKSLLLEYERTIAGLEGVTLSAGTGG